MSQKNEIDEQVHQRALPNAQVVFETIRQHGANELERPSKSLAWSAFAAGMSMGFSLITQGVMQRWLPEGVWRPLVVKLGYSLGFLIVILGRQQLFTENTLTAILPFLAQRNRHNWHNVARLWGVVLAFNLLGALACAAFIRFTSAFPPDVHRIFCELGTKVLEPAFSTLVVRGIFAGWLIALMIWLMPFAESFRVVVIVVLTYVIGLGEFPHVIAGAVEAFYVGLAGAASWAQVIPHFLLATLIGNVIGGVALVSVFGYAQVSSPGLEN